MKYLKTYESFKSIDEGFVDSAKKAAVGAAMAINSLVPPASVSIPVVAGSATLASCTKHNTVYVYKYSYKTLADEQRGSTAVAVEFFPLNQKLTDQEINIEKSKLDSNGSPDGEVIDSKSSSFTLYTIDNSGEWSGVDKSSIGL